MASVKETIQQSVEARVTTVTAGWTPPAAFAVEVVLAAMAEQPRAYRPLVVPSDEDWFWTDRWQHMEREADAEIEAGRSTVYDSTDEFLSALDEL